MDRISIRITDDRFGDENHRRSVEFDVDLSHTDNAVRALPVNLVSDEREFIAPTPVPGDVLEQQLRAATARADALEAVLNREQVRPRFQGLSATFEVLPDDDDNWVYQRDNVNQLIWSRTLRDANGEVLRLTSGTVDEPGEDARACAALGPGFRLPTRVEAATLVDDTRHAPATFAPFVADTESAAYATSSPVSGWPHNVWAVYFYDGNVYGSGRSLRRCVRAVRSLGPSSAGQ